VGIDIEQLLAGARHALDAAQPDELLKNRAALYSALLWSADTTLGAKLHVLMPYSDRLREFAEWYRQLWAESLGKAQDRRGSLVNRGPTPIAAVGATDQHSQVQLFMEGPFDKVVSFVTVENFGNDVAIPNRSDQPADLAYLSGHTLGELLRAEQVATAAALARMGRMNSTLELPDLSARSLGEAIMFFQIATGYAGAWYGVNPFDQPGVELGKKLTYAAMGRPGFAADSDSAPSDDGDVV
jgi:glucose-6-phosphate isomerase